MDCPEDCSWSHTISVLPYPALTPQRLCRNLCSSSWRDSPGSWLTRDIGLKSMGLHPTNVVTGAHSHSPRGRTEKGVHRYSWADLCFTQNTVVFDICLRCVWSYISGKPMVHWQSALVLEEWRWKQEGGKMPRWEMNLCISPGKMHFSHSSNRLAYGKKDCSFQLLCQKKK